MDYVTTAGKEFQFHAAHQLPNHDGQCRRRHGHTYTLRLEIAGFVKPLTGGSDEGMLIDFGWLKKAYKELLEPHFEHQDLNETVTPLLESYNLPAVTTCEVMTWLVWEILTKNWEAIVGTENFKSRRVWLSSVTLYETPTSYARVAE